MSIEKEDKTQKVSRLIRLLILNLKDEEIAVPVKNIVEVDLLPKYTKVPNIHKVILGVANLRGDVVSLIDGRQFFAGEQITFSDSTRVVYISNDKIMTGLVVDGISEIVDVKEEKIMPIGEEGHGIVNKVSYGLFSLRNNVIRILNVDKFFSTNIVLQYQ